MTDMSAEFVLSLVFGVVSIATSGIYLFVRSSMRSMKNEIDLKMGLILQKWELCMSKIEEIGRRLESGSRTFEGLDEKLDSVEKDISEIKTDMGWVKLRMRKG